MREYQWIHVFVFYSLNWKNTVPTFSEVGF